MSAAMFAGASLLIAVLAPSPTEVLGPAFANTITSLYPDGKTTKLWLNSNGSYDALRANGQRTGGSWALKGDKLCMTQKRPIYVPLAFCTAIPSMKGGVGASWMAKGLKGEPVRHTITAGR
ncbi:MAG: hypothetical protein KA105_05910 [Caulobacter sp.]|jgi:hypothetical protein|nr:hypothetical protein [Caulobacter sp.]